MNFPKNSRRARLITSAGLVGAGVLAGSVLGLTGAASAATTTTPTSTSSTTTSPTTPPKWHSNTNPAHEAAESPAKAAAEAKADATGIPPAGFEPGNGPAPAPTTTG